MAFSRGKTGKLTQDAYSDSVRDMHRIYSNMNPDEFAAFYVKRWGGNANAVLRIIATETV